MPGINSKIIPELVANEAGIRRVQITAMVCKAFKALDSAANLTEFDPAWLWKLKVEGKCAFEEKEVERAFMEAAKSNFDDGIFKKAVAARASPLNGADIKDQINKVEWFLLEWWLAAEYAPFCKSLCYYNDTALSKLVAFMLGNNQGHNGKSIRKVWERLGLEKGKPLLFRDIEIKNNPETNKLEAAPILYKKLIQL
jgi:hypothetical protein